jgi:F0F1-type ATP synthase assembly protein I
MWYTYTVSSGAPGLIMATKKRKYALARSVQSWQQSVQRAGPAAMASYSLIGSIVLLGGLGYAIDQWRGTFPGFFLGGLILGLVAGFYQLAKALWRR